MTKYLFFTALALPLMACTPHAGQLATTVDMAPPMSATKSAYMALGTEPGWTIEITPDRLNYNGDYGETQIIVPNPGAKPLFNGERYTTERLNVDVTHILCRDGMSDRRYADTVVVRADGKEFKGCGGAILPSANLSGTQWTIRSINGKDIIAGDPAELRFQANELSGRAGCNRFSGPYSSDSKHLTVATLMTTRMACGDPHDHSGHASPAMTQEQDFFALLADPISLRFTPEGRLVLVGTGGKSAVLEPMK